MGIHEQYMTRCIALALKGAGSVAPNPMVGAVLVYQNRIIGEGCHQLFGSPHAEVNCFSSVAEEDLHCLNQSVLYVSLEPCAHFGKTPPCADLIILKGVSKVVVGCRDPFDCVNGKGIERLKDAGIEVIEGVLEKECLDLNKRFFRFHLQKRPYIILKWAQTADGKIAADTAVNAERLLISNEFTNTVVHRWRSEEAAILVGTNTALLDDPALNNRLWKGKPPMRMVIDTGLRLPESLRLFTDEHPVVMYNYRKEATIGAVIFKKISNENSVLVEILEDAYSRQLLSILVEGGAKLLQSFIDAGLWDEARVITNTSLTIKEGLAAPVLKDYLFIKEEQLLEDHIAYFYRL